MISMTVSPKVIKNIAILVAGIVLISGISLIIASATSVSSKNVETLWTLQDKGYFGPSAISISYVYNGTIYGFESGNDAPDGRHFYYFVAISLNGTLKWRVGLNAMPVPRPGADGKFYYIDWQDVSDIAGNWSRANWCNLTALDSEGRFKWDYVVDLGSLEIWATYSDGTVIVHHSLVEFNYTLSKWVNKIDEAIAISGNGNLLWSRPMPSPVNGYYISPRVAQNGTLIVLAGEDNGTYEIGVNSSNGNMYVEKTDDYYGYVGSDYRTTNGSILYEVRNEPIDLNRTVTSVYAINMTDGTKIWQTVLHYSDNPDHLPPGCWSGRGTLVDGKGVIFCGDIDGKYVYALNPDGAIRWNSTEQLVFQTSVPNGGAIVNNGNLLEQINEDGGVIWWYKSESLDWGPYGSVQLLPDGTVIFSTGDTVKALSTPSSAIEDNTILIGALLVAASIIMIAAILIMSQSRYVKK
jgi:hypothetical protein